MPAPSLCTTGRTQRSDGRRPDRGPATTGSPRRGPPATGRIGPVTTRRLATLHVWGVPGWSVPAALLRMATDRRPLRRSPGLRFAKLLGTGSGRTFTVADADPRHWALVAVWDDDAAADAFADGALV